MISLRLTPMKAGVSSVVPLCLLGALATSSTLTVQPAFAQAPITAPQDGSLVNNSALATKLGRFLQNEARERKLPAESGAPAKIWFWKGDAYKPGRMAFKRSAYRRSLETAGFDFKEIDSHSVSTNIFEVEYGLARYDGEPEPTLIKLEIGDRLDYFVATHKTTGRTLLGVWIDQEEAGDCLLAVAEVGTKAPVKAPVLPNVQGANVVLVKNPRNVMQGATPLKTPTFKPMVRKPGFARGMALDMNGKPLQGATIVLQSSAMGGFRTSVTTKTNAQGVYEVKLPTGICQVVNADYRAPYGEGTLLLPLHTVDGQRETFDSAKGHVENFVLRTWGLASAEDLARWPESGGAYYGAPIRVQWFYDGLPEEGTIEITLKPRGPLVDGRPGRTFVIRLPLRTDSVLSADEYINNIPIGRYTMTAVLRDGNDTMPLHIGKVFSNDEPVETLAINFSSYSHSYASLERSGVALYEVILKP